MPLAAKKLLILHIWIVPDGTSVIEFNGIFVGTTGDCDKS
jgi:hypothetical protein